MATKKTGRRSAAEDYSGVTIGDTAEEQPPDLGIGVVDPEAPVRPTATTTPAPTKANPYGFQSNPGTTLWGNRTQGAAPSDAQVNAVLQAVGFSPEFIAQNGARYGPSVAMALSYGQSPQRVAQAIQDALNGGLGDWPGGGPDPGSTSMDDRARNYERATHDARLATPVREMLGQAGGAGAYGGAGFVQGVLGRMRTAAGLDAQGYAPGQAPSGAPPVRSAPWDGGNGPGPGLAPPGQTGAGDPGGTQAPPWGSGPRLPSDLSGAGDPGGTQGPPLGPGPQLPPSTAASTTAGVSRWAPPSSRPTAGVPPTPVQQPWNPSAGVSPTTQPGGWRPPGQQRPAQQPNQPRRYGIYF